MSDINILRSVVILPRRIARFLGGLLFKAILRLQRVSYGTRLRAGSCAICKRHPGSRISIGADVVILNCLSENLAGITHRTVLATSAQNAELVIGNDVKISGAILFCTTSIHIEDHVNIGAGARIYDTDFHPLDPLARRAHIESQIQCAPVRICEDVWLGAGAMVLKGVTVGARSIVAAGAIVTKDVPPDCIVAGSPARIVKHLSAPSATFSDNAL